MNLTSTLVGIAFAIFCSGTSYAQGAVRPKVAPAVDIGKQRQILEVLTQAGVHKALEESAAAYERQLKKGIPEEALKEDGSALNKSVRDSLAPNRLAFFIAREVAATMNQQEIQSLSNWFSSPTGRKVVDAQVRGLHLMRDEAFLLKSGKEEERQLTMNRISLINELLRTTREGAVMASMAIAVGTTTLQKLNEGSPKPEMLAFFVKSIEDQRPAMTARFEGVARARIAVTMKSISDDEMKALIKFEATPEERKFSAAVAKGTEFGVLDALEQLILVSKSIEERRRLKKV